MRKQDSFNEMYNIFFYRRHKNSLSMLLFLAQQIFFILLLFNGLSCTEQPNLASCLRRKFRDKSATDKNIAWNK